MNRWKAILAAAVIFGAGFVTGAISDHWLRPQAHPLRLGQGAPMTPWTAQRKALLRRMVRELGLDPAQHERVQQIINQSQERLRKVWEPIAPQARAEFHQLHNEIRAELRPAQQEKFDAIFRKGPHRPENGSGRKEHQGPATGSTNPSSPDSKP